MLVNLFLIAALLFVVLCSCALLGWLLLLLAALRFGLGLLSQRLFQNLQNLLVSDLLVTLDGGEIWAWRCSKLLNTILGNG